MAQRLMDVGQVVSETQVIAKLLDLPQQYMHLVSAWDVLEDAKQTRANLIPRLLKAEKLCCGGGLSSSSVQGVGDNSARRKIEKQAERQEQRKE